MRNSFTGKAGFGGEVMELKSIRESQLKKMSNWQIVAMGCTDIETAKERYRAFMKQLRRIRKEELLPENQEPVIFGRYTGRCKTEAVFCKLGHAFTLENTYRPKDKKFKFCRTCYNAYRRSFDSNIKRKISVVA